MRTHNTATDKITAFYCKVRHRSVSMQPSLVLRGNKDLLKTMVRLSPIYLTAVLVASIHLGVFLQQTITTTILNMVDGVDPGKRLQSKSSLSGSLGYACWIAMVPMKWMSCWIDSRRAIVGYGIISYVGALSWLRAYFEASNCSEKSWKALSTSQLEWPTDRSYCCIWFELGNPGYQTWHSFSFSSVHSHYILYLV